jgi:hypothetical protein
MVSYPGIPNGYSIDGKVFVESPTVSGRFLQPDGVIFYSYFHSKEADEFRRALALSYTPTFPSVVASLPFDDKIVGLILAQPYFLSMPRGYLPAGPVSFEGEKVFKWGNKHCGEDKAKANGSIVLPEPALVEPFIEGTSERILIVGDSTWHLRYESADWRKNVEAKITILDKPNRLLAHEARYAVDSLRLNVAGLDFIVTSNGAHLLEVNAYPELSDVPDAQDAFVNHFVSWWIHSVLEAE